MRPHRWAKPLAAIGFLLMAGGIALAVIAQRLKPPMDGWSLEVLGIAQDAGIPQLYCEQKACVDRRTAGRPERVAALGLRHRPSGKVFLFDASPDLRSQVDSIAGGRPLDGIFLTHAHIGHYTGLMFLGRESINASRVPVYGTDRMVDFLTANGPWSLLVKNQNVEVRRLTLDRAVDLGDGMRVTAFQVPHRDEFTDTVGYRLEGPRRKAIYIPDIDQWSKWNRDIRALVETVDLAFLDGTFAAADEIPGRSIADIPHPLMSVTRELLKGVRAAVWFIHLNHTNREINAVDVVKDGMRFDM